MKNLILLLLLLLIPVSAGATDFYVSKLGDDSNNCTNAQSTTQTLQKESVVDALQCLDGPDDRLLIHTGVYSNDRIFEDDFGGTGTSWAAPITIMPYGDGPVEIELSSGGDNVVRFANAAVHYVIIKGLIFDGALGMEESTMWFTDTDSDHIRFEDVEMKDGRGHGWLLYGVGHECIRCNIHNIGGSAAYTINNGIYGVSDNAIIRGGKVWNNECYGIRFWDSDTGQDASNNIIDGVEIYQNGLGIGLNGTSTCGAGGGGVTLADTGNVVMNSVIRDNFYGIEFFHFQSIDFAEIYNNTITRNEIYGLYVPFEANNTKYYNNIVCSNDTQDIVDSSSTSDDGTGGSPGSNLTTCPDFADVSGKNFALVETSTAAIDTGQTVAAVTADILGVPRPDGIAYDKGAYEFDSEDPPPIEDSHPEPIPGGKRARKK